MQQPKPLWLQGRIEIEDPGGVAPRPVEAGDEAAGNGVIGKYSDDRDRFCGGHRRPRRNFAAYGDEHGDLATNKFRRHGGQAIIFAECPPVFDRDTLIFDRSVFSQPAPEGSQQARALDRRSCTEKTDCRNRLLRSRSESPDGRRCQPRDKLPPSHFANLPFHVQKSI